jgi:hypothetical protein
MPEIRIDRTSSGRKLPVVLSKERERVNVEAFKLLIKVVINTAITSSTKAVPIPENG